MNFPKLINFSGRLEGKNLLGYDGINTEVHATSGLEVRFWYKENLFAASNASVFRSQDKGITWEEVARLAPSRKGIVGESLNSLARMELIRKLRGESGFNLRVLRDGSVLAGSGNIYHGRIEEGKISRLEKVHEVANWLPQGWTEDREGAVLIGEYQYNQHAFTRLCCSWDQGRTWDVTHEFPRREINHIHCVAYDPYRNLIWVTTGDDDHESRIFYTPDQGFTLQELGGGSQEWRAVSLQFTNKAIFWGMDSQYFRNYKENCLVKWDWDTGRKEVLLTCRNPFFYSANDGNGKLFFSTAVEAPELTGGSKFAEIWMIGDDKISCLVRWPAANHKNYGVIQFAQGEAPPGWIAVTPMNLLGHHFETLVIRIP